MSRETAPTGLPSDWEQWPAPAKAAHLSLEYDRAELLAAVARAADVELDREPTVDTRLRVGELARVLIAIESDRSMTEHLDP